MEIVLCTGLVRSAEDLDTFKMAVDHGFTSVQIYTFWGDIEPQQGVFDWSKYDGPVEMMNSVGLKYLPFLIMGPAYGQPTWWPSHRDHVPLRCLEHRKDCPIESIWNKAFHPHIERVLAAMADHYGKAGVLEAVMPGICGDYGESIFPVVGNWPGNYHTHGGFWAGGDDAAADYRKWLGQRYESLDRLNKAWRSRYERFEEIRPVLRHRSPSQTAHFDMVSWYRDSMTVFSDHWMSRCRHHFPKLPLYLCTGGSEQPQHGSSFADQARICAAHGAGIRLTNESNRFADNFAATAHCVSACRFYGSYIGLEPVGPMTAEGVRARVFGSLAYANRQIFHYGDNVFEKKSPRPAAAALHDFLQHYSAGPVEDGVAVFWPEDQGVFEEHIPQGVSDAANFIRREYPVSLISERMILDGALKRFELLLMFRTYMARAEVLVEIARWVKEDGGKLLLSGRVTDLEMEPVPAFNEMVGVGPDSEETVGHVTEYVEAPQGWPRLAKIKEYHTTSQTMDLLPGTEMLSATRPGAVGAGNAQARQVSSLFRRCYPSGGWAVSYSGQVDFTIDSQAIFVDAGVFPALLGDACALSGVAPLGTRSDEIARARVGSKVLALTDRGIEVRS